MNENHPVGEKQNWLASRQGRAGQARQSWTGKAELDRQGRAGQARQSWTGKAELDRQGRAGQARQSWTGRTRLDRTQTTSNIRYEPTRNCKHKEILKGANDEGNEGKQLGKMNQ